MISISFLFLGVKKHVLDVNLNGTFDVSHWDRNVWLYEIPEDSNMVFILSSRIMLYRYKSSFSDFVFFHWHLRNIWNDRYLIINPGTYFFLCNIMNKIVCQSQGQYQNIIQLRHSVKQTILVKLYRNIIHIIFGFV